MQTPTALITQTGDLGGQKVAMGFDENSLSHLMSILTDLYSDKEMAVIREYATNARDSHIEAGVTEPIEVTTPSALNPYLRIIDHGVGLSVDDITNMYSKYGASTKRGTNDQVGMLGIGAKSGLTLSPQFTLTSVKNGVKIIVSVSRSADGSGQMEIFDTQATTERNGVEISIPVNDRYSILNKCQELFRFWDPGTVLINGKEPSYIDGQKVGSSFLIVENLYTDYIVMGNVPYPVKDGLYDMGSRYYGGRGIVARVEIGDVHFAPSREALQYTAQTNATIEKLRAEFGAHLYASAQVDMDTATSFDEAWKKANTWKDNAGVEGLKYKKKVVPHGTINLKKAKYQHLSGYGANGANHIAGITLNVAKNHIIITNVPDSMKLTPTQRAKIKIHMDTNRIYTVSRALLVHGPQITEDLDHEAFLSGVPTVDWSDIIKIKIARSGSVGVVRTDPYDLYVDGYSTTQVRTLDTSKPIAYYSTAEFDGRCTWMTEALPDTQIIVLSKNRWGKFTRDFPTAVHYRKMILDNLNVYVKKLTDADKIMWHWYNEYNWIVKNWDHTKIDDPDVAAFVKAMNVDGWSDAAKAIRKVQSIGRVPVPIIPTVPNPLTKYPLAGKLRSVDNEHALWYLNTYFKEI